MRLSLPSAAAILFMVPGAAFAQQASLSELDVFYAHTRLSVEETPGDVQDGGYGARLWAGRNWPIVTAEYQKSDFDGRFAGATVAGEIEDMRVGLGVRLIESAGFSAWGRGEYLTLESLSTGSLSFDEDGTALHVGARFGNRAGGALIEIGGVKTDNTDGLEARAGLAWEPANWGLFTEYRHTELKPDGSNNNVRIAVWRGGVRWNF